MSRQRLNDEWAACTELKLVQILREEDYTLNAVNNYRENLLHISVANGCFEMVNEILKKEELPRRLIDRKNQFGWTALMLAIRNRDIEMTKLLLEKNANTDESTYLGMSVLGLAAAISREMFETVYSSCPSVLGNTENDDITPLCIAAMRNDKELFFRLLDLGLNDALKSSRYTQLMMGQSSVPEISGLATDLSDVFMYWSDTSDNIDVEHDFTRSTSPSSRQVAEKENLEGERMVESLSGSSSNRGKSSRKRMMNLSLKPLLTFDWCDKRDTTRDFKNQLTIDKNSLSVETVKSAAQNIISPTLMCDIDQLFPPESNVCFIEKPSGKNDSPKIRSIFTDVSPVHRSQSLRSSCSVTPKCQNELDTTLGYSPDFSPMRSPNVPSDINDENVFGGSTPTPPRYRTPPRGMILNSQEAKMSALLKRFRLSHCLPIFLEQEDLIEIGIRNSSDRQAIIAAIHDYRKMDF